MAVTPALIALTAASGAIGAYGAYASGQAASAAASYNARLQERDAYVAEQNRQAVIEQTRIAAEDSRRDNRRELASIRAAYGASGLDLAGSPLDVLQDTATEQELDTRRVEYEGSTRAREGALQILGLREGANLSRMEGRNARRAGTLSAIGAATGGAGRTLERMG